MTATQQIIAIITAMGGGAILSSIIDWLRNRKKIASEVDRQDLDKELAKLKTVIERLDADNARSFAERDRLAAELSMEQSRSSDLRKRVRELEDEVDGVRRSAREMQTKCDHLAARLRQFEADFQEPTQGSSHGA